MTTLTAATPIDPRRLAARILGAADEAGLRLVRDNGLYDRVRRTCCAMGALAISNHPEFDDPDQYDERSADRAIYDLAFGGVGGVGLTWDQAVAVSDGFEGWPREAKEGADPEYDLYYAIGEAVAKAAGETTDTGDGADGPGVTQ